MQPIEKNAPKKILAALANVPAWESGGEQAASDFVLRYGPLRRPPYNSPPVQPKDYALDVVGVAVEFRKAWSARTQAEMDHVSIFLDSIFEPNPYATWEGAAVRADFARRQWEPAPRTLLDHIAIELMRSRKALHRCERPECQRYMVKEFSRDRYCSRVCAEDMRSRGQSKWAEDNREQIKRRRRKESIHKRRK